MALFYTSRPWKDFVCTNIKPIRMDHWCRIAGTAQRTWTALQLYGKSTENGDFSNSNLHVIFYVMTLRSHLHAVFTQDGFMYMCGSNWWPYHTKTYILLSCCTLLVTSIVIGQWTLTCEVLHWLGEPDFHQLNPLAQLKQKKFSSVCLEFVWMYCSDSEINTTN
jgi:hypothetical protein